MGTCSKEGTPVSILFISAEDTGHGHKSITQSLEHQIKLLNPHAQVCVVDGFALGGPVLKHLGRLYNPIASLCPRLWGAFYRAVNHPVRTINFAASLLIRRALIRLVREREPDIIVSVHALFVGSVLNALEHGGISVPVISVIADLDNVAALWGDSRTSFTLCPSIESCETMRKQGLLPHRLKTVGFPVRADFCNAEDVPPAGLIGDEASVMIVSGSQGSWQVLKMARLVLEHTYCSVTIVAGRNEALRLFLTEKLTPYPRARVQVHGFVTDMKTQMQTADVLIIRASPNVLMEAVNLCRPVIITGALFGQEERNPDYVLRYGLGVVCRDSAKLPQALDGLLADNGKRLREIAENQRNFRDTGASREIARFILENAQGMSVDCSSPLELGGNMAAAAE